MRIEIEGLNVVAVYCDNLEESLNFYTQVLGFEKKAEIEEGIQIHFGDENHGISLYLQGGYRRDSREYKVSKISLCFNTSSVKSALNKARELNLPINFEYKEISAHHAMFCVLDPSGNQIMLMGKP